MKKIIQMWWMVGMLVGLLTSCSTAVDPSDAYKGESQQVIYQRGREALQGRSYAEAVKRFEALDVQYPYGSETENAQLYLIYAYYMKEDYLLAVAAADRYIRLHPTSPHVDYAYYMRGVSNYYQNLGAMERLFSLDMSKRDLTQLQKAYVDFNEVVTRFPNGPYAAASHQYMIYLRNMMANHELQIAQYYYDRKAYIAAANRSADLVTHYQGAPATVDGLVLMAKSYNKLGLAKQTQDTLMVLKYNYPNKQIDMR